MLKQIANTAQNVNNTCQQAQGAAAVLGPAMGCVTIAGVVALLGVEDVL